MTPHQRDRRPLSGAPGHALWRAIALPVLLTAGAAHADGLAVTVTSKPIHSLVASVMAGVGTPSLIVDGQASPHTFALKPSAAAAIQSSNVFFRVSRDVEPFSEKILAALPASVTAVTLADAPGLTLLDKRSGGTFEPHDHDHEHGKEEHGHDDHDDDHGEAGVKDGHVWLDPENAKAMVAKIAAVLSEKDPGHAEAYAKNAAATSAGIDAAAEKVKAQLSFPRRAYFVFHDAYQYFEARFGIPAAGSITMSPDVQPSAKRLAAVRKKLAANEAACVFAEPLYNAKLLAAVTEGTKAGAGTLDPEGLLLKSGPDLYEKLLTGIASGLETCLTGKPARR